MQMFKTYRGGRLDLEFYKGKASLDYEIEVFNDDDTEFDLAIYDDIKLEIAHKIHGTIVVTLTMALGEVTVYSPADNIVLLNVPDHVIDLRPKEYWYECYGLVDDEQELIFFGVAKVL